MAGEKFIGWGPNGVLNDTTYIYNLDLSLYRAMPLPALPAGWAYSSPMYVTESLFDTDPSTIEYLVFASGSGPAHDTRVYREDGTLLFSAPSSQLQPNGWWMPPIISTTIAGTYMILHDLNVGTTVYQLPGQLPCVECDGSLITGGGGEQLCPTIPFMFAYPNPSAGETLITYELPLGETRGELIFFDTQGKELRRSPVDGSGSLQVSTTQLPAATYLYQLETSQGVIGTKRLVVVR